ncbi:MAG: hypothetical protein U9N31_02150 [Candidatus Marinimicrobia bacterium]|nr:hypothetical protein [Candidatus Neomarinimicrobiota bacterium]
MRRIILMHIFLVGLYGQRLWSGTGTSILENGRNNIGLTSPFLMGVSGGEISINKFLLMPNVSYKYPITRFGEWQRTVRYQVAYPTMALRWFQSPLGMKLGEPDMFALISPEFHIPQMLSFYGELIGSTGSNEAGFVTVYGGIGIGLGGEKLDSRTSIDLPGFYPRFSIYHNGILIKAGGGYLRQFKERWSYTMDYDMFIMPGGEGRYAFEHLGFLIWTKSNRFRLLFGYKLIAGEYPYGSQAHLLPLVDVQFGW